MHSSLSNALLLTAFIIFTLCGAGLFSTHMMAGCPLSEHALLIGSIVLPLTALFVVLLSLLFEYSTGEVLNLPERFGATPYHAPPLLQLPLILAFSDGILHSKAY